ncbi:hypothetical protein AB0K40_13150 [Nonomuraea bangladeshensis]|uniref:Uncharacterized protein n=1 Tax=Nonomuraea bangladeshensis TaxID=404385 RepID=A0ABV3H1M4_9ACTN
MTMPFAPNTGNEALAAISRATMPRDGIDEAAVSHVALMEEIERFGDRAKSAHALVHARSLTVQAIDSAERPVGDPCTTPGDVLDTWRTHRDAGVSIPVGHHAGQTVIAIRADSLSAWNEWLSSMVAIDRPRADFDGRTFATERVLREMGPYALLTSSTERTPTMGRTLTFTGQRGLVHAAEALRPQRAEGPVYAAWIVGHRSNLTPAGQYAVARPTVKGRNLSDGVKLLKAGDLVPLVSAVGSGTKINGDLAPQIEATSTGFDTLASVLLLIWQ